MFEGKKGVDLQAKSLKYRINSIDFAFHFLKKTWSKIWIYLMMALGQKAEAKKEQSCRKVGRRQLFHDCSRTKKAEKRPKNPLSIQRKICLPSFQIQRYQNDPMIFSWLLCEKCVLHPFQKSGSTENDLVFWGFRWSLAKKHLSKCTKDGKGNRSKGLFRRFAIWWMVQLSLWLPFLDCRTQNETHHSWFQTDSNLKTLSKLISNEYQITERYSI